MSIVGSEGDIQQLITAGKESLVKGRLPAGLVANAELYELEAERVFGPCWQFLAHETEVPQAGDYVVRYLAGSSIIVVRGEDGTVRAMANSCRHRGTMLCRTEMGNTSHFRCPYHGWTYKNTGTLAGVPAQQDVYGVEMDKSMWSLTPVPHVDNYGGLIFGCLDDKAPSLADYLGDMTWYLDLITKRSPGGLEVRGEPQRWIIDANWKLGSDNFVGDAYHTLMTHRSGWNSVWFRRIRSSHHGQRISAFATVTDSASWVCHPERRCRPSWATHKRSSTDSSRHTVTKSMWMSCGALDSFMARCFLTCRFLTSASVRTATPRRFQC